MTPFRQIDRCTRVNIHTYTYIHTEIRTHIHPHRDTHTRTATHTYAHKHRFTHTHTQGCVHSLIHTTHRHTSHYITLKLQAAMATE